jgi:uncharacterized protein
MSAIFYMKLIPPRPTFPADMTDTERGLMQQHAVYMRELFDAGRVLVYGPVMAATGAFGMGVLDAADEVDARSMLEADPTIVAGMNTYELWPMHLGGAQGRRDPS